MKGRFEIERAVRTRFERRQLEHLAGISSGWPHRIALGHPTKAELSAEAPRIARTIDELTEWTRTAPVQLLFERRRVGGALHEVPTYAVIETVDDAAKLCGRSAERLLARNRVRADELRCRFDPSGSVLLRVLKATAGYDDVDFSLLVDASCWFRDHDATGLTPRQVPLPGFSAKWIDSPGRRGLVQDLCGRQLALQDRARSLEFAYLDPEYLATGARRYDSYVWGDAIALPYEVELAVIVENKDTFRAFPPCKGGICLFGSGWAGTTLIPGLPWLREVATVCYWGDIDADGFGILDAYRAAGLAVESVLMDARTYERYERFGTDFSTGATALAERREKPLEYLTEEERALYRRLVSPACSGHRRVEQERIPFAELGKRFWLTRE